MPGPKKRIGRDAAMSARPFRRKTGRRFEKNGKRYVTVTLERPRWQLWLGASEACERTFGLDAYGQEVYDACDGNLSVTRIVEAFARNHSISRAEAEVAVTTFIKMLVGKGLVGIEVDKSAVIG